MRLKKTSAFCGLLLIAGLTFLLCERNLYNVVSREALLLVREKLKVLTPQEKKDLASFIHEAISFDQYPYTLIGYKPMSLSVVIVEDTEDLLINFRESLKRPRYQNLRRGYLVWEKYRDLFPSKEQILINYSFLGRGRKEIALICPKLCRTTIQDSLNDFQETLGRPCTTEEVFEILTHPEHTDFYTIVDRTRLIGILLGFGRNNACLYEQHRGGASRSMRWRRLPEQDPLEMFSNQWPWPGVLLPPNFACDPNTNETQQLKKHYKKGRKIVWWTYFLRNKLEVTLALFMQN